MWAWLEGAQEVLLVFVVLAWALARKGLAGRGRGEIICLYVFHSAEPHGT